MVAACTGQQVPPLGPKTLGRDDKARKSGLQRPSVGMTNLEKVGRKGRSVGMTSLEKVGCKSLLCSVLRANITESILCGELCK
jgi:hypothetical protein